MAIGARSQVRTAAVMFLNLGAENCASTCRDAKHLPMRFLTMEVACTLRGTNDKLCHWPLPSVSLLGKFCCVQATIGRIVETVDLLADEDIFKVLHVMYWGSASGTSGGHDSQFQGDHVTQEVQRGFYHL